MPPGKKAVKKVVNEEDRILQMERQKIADKEAAKKKELMLCEYLKIKMQKENKDLNLNLKTTDYNTRFKMRRNKVEELQKESFILFQTFERILDLKNVTIKNLLKNIEESERQYETSVSSHMENVDRVIDFQRHVLHGQSAAFNQECDELTREYEEECRGIEEKNKKDLSDLADIFFSLKTNYDDRRSRIDLNFQNQIDEIKNKSLEEKHSLKAQLDVIGDNLWKEFRQTYDNYNKSTDERRRLFEELSSKDVLNSAEIAEQRKKLQKLAESINSSKVRLGKNQREDERINSKLRQEKDKTNKIFYSMKSDMNRLRLLERDRLNQVAVRSNSALGELDRILATGKKLLVLAEQCRKMETEEEKILPFYQESGESGSLPKEDDPEREMMWKRYNAVSLDVMCLQDSHKKLVAENLYLKNILKQYLDGLSVNQAVLENDNSLFVVNGKTNAPVSTDGLDYSRALQAVKHL